MSGVYILCPEFKPGDRKWVQVTEDIRAQVVCHPDEIYVNQVLPNTDEARDAAEQWLKKHS